MGTGPLALHLTSPWAPDSSVSPVSSPSRRIWKSAVVHGLHSTHCSGNPQLWSAEAFVGTDSEAVEKVT